MWIRFLLAILFLPGLMSCGRGVNGPAADRGDFETYFQKFERYSNEMGRSTFGDDTMSITFEKLREHEAGRCEWHIFKGRRILIDPDKWKTMDELTREALIAHELGHCLLRRDHAEGTTRIPDVRPAAENKYNEAEFVGPKSLMNPTAVPGTVYDRNREYYMKELFGKLP